MCVISVMHANVCFVQCLNMCVVFYMLTHIYSACIILRIYIFHQPVFLLHSEAGSVTPAIVCGLYEAAAKDLII